VNVGIFMLVVVDETIYHLPGTVGSGGVVKPDQVLIAVDLFRKDGKIGAYGFEGAMAHRREEGGGRSGGSVKIGSSGMAPGAGWRRRLDDGGVGGRNEVRRRGKAFLLSPEFREIFRGYPGDLKL
jgi:hypothetical protein